MAQFTVMSGKKDAEGVVERREVLVQRHLQDLHQGRDHPDEGDEAQEAEIQIRRPGHRL